MNKICKLVLSFKNLLAVFTSLTKDVCRDVISQQHQNPNTGITSNCTLPIWWSYKRKRQWHWVMKRTKIVEKKFSFTSLRSDSYMKATYYQWDTDWSKPHIKTTMTCIESTGDIFPILPQAQWVKNVNCRQILLTRDSPRCWLLPRLVPSPLRALAGKQANACCMW